MAARPDRRETSVNALALQGLAPDKLESWRNRRGERRPQARTALIGGAKEARAAKRRNRNQTAILNDLATCSLIGSAASVIVFCARAPMSLACAVTAWTCLRANSLCKAIRSDSDFTAKDAFT